MSLLWTQREAHQGRASLRQVIHELTDTLSPTFAHLLTVDRNQLTLRGDALWIDADVTTWPEKPSLRLLELAGYILLEDLADLDPAFDRWLERERQRVAVVARTIREGILTGPLDCPGQLAAAGKLLGVDRTHEGVWRAIMRASADLGDRAAALAAYDQCRVALAEYRKAVPSPETDELLARIRDPDVGTHAHTIITTPEITVDRLTEPELHIHHRGLRTALRLKVLPLRTIGPVPEDELSVGLAEEITTTLSHAGESHAFQGHLLRL